MEGFSLQGKHGMSPPGADRRGWRLSVPGLVLRKLGGALLTMLAVSLLIFAALEVNAGDVAIKVLGPFSLPDQRQSWLQEHGYLDPFHLRYLRWVGDFLLGQWGTSTYYREDVLSLVISRLAASSILAAGAMMLITCIGLTLGVVAGAREGSAIDRLVSAAAVVTTSIPEFASATFLTALLVFWLGWLPGASAMTAGLSLRELVLPVAVLSMSSTGHITRVTRATMADVMAAPYIHAARMKGCSPWRIVVHHALRNALVAPVTLILLQVPWLLSNVVVVEVFFAYKGFGTLLYEASLNSDIRLIEACAMVSVVVVVATQALSDLSYVFLDPRAAARTASKPGRSS
jgi:peptide/nickel transport system permease protein